jgi:hypothetical protein
MEKFLPILAAYKGIGIASKDQVLHERQDQSVVEISGQITPHLTATDDPSGTSYEASSYALRFQLRFIAFYLRLISDVHIAVPTMTVAIVFNLA